MNKSEEAINCFHNAFNCAQAVFSTYAEKGGIPKEKALKIAGSFGGGMAYLGEVCGAVTGAYMAIGLMHGKSIAVDNAAKEKTYAMVQEFTEKFKELHGSINCTKLIGCDLSTKEGYEIAASEGRFRARCDNYVRDAAAILDEMGM